MRIKELFTVPEGQKVTEKVFGKVLISSICSILLCMACLVSTTWAWFSLDITSTNNAIQIGEFAVNVVVKNAANNDTIAGNTEYDLTTGDYVVTISSAAESTASGYCIVRLGGQEYKTIRLCPIGAEGNNPSSVSFEIKVAENKIEVTDTTPELTDGSTTPKTVTLTITPVWGAPENNDGLGSAGQQDLTAAIDVYVLAESEETTEPEGTTEPEENTEPEDTTAPTTTATESTTTATESTTTATESTTTATEPTTEPTGTVEPTETTAAAESEGTAE